MEAVRLVCTSCGHVEARLDAGRCARCGGIVLAQYEKAYLDRGIDTIDFKHLKKGIFQFDGVLPPVQQKNRVTICEAGTPLVDARRLREKIGCGQLLIKDETQNTTGSFKDRPISVCLSVAKELGCHRVVVASSGNGAAAVAAYSASAGMENTVFVPERTPDAKVAQALAYGGRVVRVPGNFSNSYSQAIEAAKQDGVLNLTTTFLAPFGVEGDKTIAYELYAQCDPLPDHVVIPVGAGPVFYGVYKGFAELLAAGRIDRMPRLHAVQAQGCAPIVRGFRERSAVKAEVQPSTIASAICDPLIGYEENGDLTIQAIRASNGTAMAVSDEEILRWGKLLAGTEGLFAEPASAAAIAGVYQATCSGVIGQHERVAAIITGSGLKDATAYL